MFATLSRYFAKLYLVWFGICVAGLTCVFSLFNVSELFRRSSTKESVDPFHIFQMTLLKLPVTIEIMLPFVVLFSGMIALWRLNKQNEITVTRSAGQSVWQILFPFIAVAAFIGALDLFVLNPIATKMLSHYKMMSSELLKNKKDGISISKTGIWLRYNYESGPTVIRVGHVDVGLKKITDMTILEYDQQDALRVRIDAQTAEFVEGGLQLNHVWIFPYKQAPVFHEKLPYKTTLSIHNIQDNKKDPETISFWKLPAYIHLLEASGLSSVKYRLHWQSLMARSAWLLAMILLAATAALRPIRQGRQALFILSAAAIGFALYFLRDITYAMGQSSSLPVVFAAWSPVVISAMIGVVALLNLEEH
ncbi:MAG: LPS export ABC transporter permease LptG [Alphaproteobacteria bacterium]|nr:LPS export ABC transporter permease LptG [Alphaproteobacteria bacterium]